MAVFETAPTTRARAATQVGSTWSVPGSGRQANDGAHPLLHFTAATPADEAPHSSGWKVRVHLNREGRSETGFDGCWRSGEALQGHVELERHGEAAGAPAAPISSVLVRAYWQSNTIWTSHRLVHIDKDPDQSFLSSLLKPAANGVQAVAELKGDWCRSAVEEGGEGIEVWHGGEVAIISREVAGDFPLLGLPVVAPEPPTVSALEEAGQTTLPFAFTLPTLSRITAASTCPGAPQSRRELLQFPRAPPPSLPGSDGLSGVVEWIVEVLVRFPDQDNGSSPANIAPSPLSTDPPLTSETADAPPPATPLVEEPPSFDLATANPSTDDSPFGLLSSSPTLLVHRIVFPFEPLDHHQLDLHSSWRPNVEGPWSIAIAQRQGIPIDEILDDRPNDEGRVPAIGRDARDEALGGSNMGPRRQHRGALVEKEGGRSHWSSYEKRMAIKTRLGRAVGWIRAETSLPYPALFARHASHLTVLLHLSFTLPDYSHPAPTPSPTPGRILSIDKIVLILSRRTLARGGREERPIFGLEEMRRVEMKLYEDEESSTQMSRLAPQDSRLSVRASEVENGKTHLRLECGAPGRDLKLEFPMQTIVEVGPNGGQCRPVRDLRLSMRTPNVEMEYILSLIIYPLGQPSFYAARVPLQIIAGDFMDTPSFATAVGEGSVVEQPPLPPASELPTYD